MTTYYKRAVIERNVNSLVNATDVPGMTVRAEGYVRRNNFWIGRESS